jgi:oligopeptide transport system ATP-binding protein
MSLLSVKNLNIRFRLNEGYVYAVNDVSFDIKAGGKLALVGESGSGKSQIAFSILGLLAKNGEAEGEVKFNGKNLLTARQSELNKIRAKEISIIFQDPMSSLNPYMRIDKQLSEVLEQHEGLKGRQARKRVLDVMDAVQIPDAKARLRQYPHEFSGGMRQRIVIAMSLLCNPKLIIADEPTTALDVTVQAQIMNLLGEIQRDFDTAVLLITHDLGVVAGFCTETMVLYGGRLMERANTADIFDNPTHPYTRGLLGAIPSIDGKAKGKLAVIPGSPPNLSSYPVACPFAPRCNKAVGACMEELPEMTKAKPFRACLRPVKELS